MPDDAPRDRTDLERQADVRRGHSSTLHDVLKRGRRSEIVAAQRRIRAALTRAGGNKKVAAHQLGVGRTTLYRLLQLYGLQGEGRAF